MSGATAEMRDYLFDLGLIILPFLAFLLLAVFGLDTKLYAASRPQRQANRQFFKPESDKRAWMCDPDGLTWSCVRPVTMSLLSDYPPRLEAHLLATDAQPDLRRESQANRSRSESAMR
jgi:hypothetical protein